jgi:hypothetical protein
MFLFPNLRFSRSVITATAARAHFASWERPLSPALGLLKGAATPSPPQKGGSLYLLAEETSRP